MSEVRLGADDAQRAVEVAPDSDVVICLAETPTSGFRWRADSHDGLELVSDDFTASEPAAVGGAGIHEFRLRPTRPGPALVRMRLQRHWSPDDPHEVREFALHLG